MVRQEKDKAGVAGSSIIHINETNTKWVTIEDGESKDLWIASPAKRNDFVDWGVETQDWFVNSYIFQDWFKVIGSDVDENGLYLKLDRPLRFDVYRSSTGDGSSPMEDAEIFGKAMPIAHVVHHVGIENLYLTQEIDGLNPESATRNYGNLAPEQAMHGIVFRFARDSWVRNIQTFMTGSHPIATEGARNIQIQDNYFDGAWNKGKGGNGYLRGSRVWDSLYYNNTLRNLRHITMQWCAMGNVVILNNMTNDMNMHGGWEGFNLFELNYVQVPYSHRSGSCSSCGGEGGDQEAGTWYPIWWGAGEKASKWSGASGPRNVFYRNYMIKQQVDGGDYLEYLPYFARDGSLSSNIWQLGWDNESPEGIRYMHLSLQDRVPIKDWQSNEQVDWSEEPPSGANSRMSDPHTSLFLKDVSGATGTVVSWSGIAGNTYCRGDVPPRVVGYYFASASRRACNPFFPDAINYDTFSHILFAYGAIAKDGTITVAAEDQQLLRDVAALKTEDSSLKVYLAIGGWGLGADPANMVAIATSSSARTKVGTSGAAICKSYGIDGIDLEWAPGISATQWKNIVQAASTGLQAANFNLSTSTPHSFWSSSGINTVAADIGKAVDFMSLISHDISGTTLEYANSLSKMTASVAAIHKLGFPRGQIMMGVPFYGRSRKLSDITCSNDGCAIEAGVGATSECIAAGGVGQGTFPYFSIDSLTTGGSMDLGAVGNFSDGSSSHRYVTGTGYVFDYETPQSVVDKARAATMLCLGGISVSALDQDNRAFDLTNAIWGAGALLPSAAEIVNTIKGEPLTAEGLVRSEFWDEAADQILENYPNLSMELNYQVMILLGVRALDAVASSLHEYLKFSALSEDSFALYKKWETKAFNWAIANETGKGNDFWQCSYTDSNYAHENCPGGHNTPGADVDDVYWRLTDSAGFANYMNETLGIDTSELVIGNIYVGRSSSTCFSFPRRSELPPGASNITSTRQIGDAVPETNATIIANSYEFEDDGTGRVRRISHGNSSSLQARNHINSMPAYDPEKNAQGFSPYDPDEKCRTLWHNVLVLDGDNFFPNVKDGIQAFLDEYKSFKVDSVALSSSPFAKIGTLAPSLQLALTILVSGNDTLYSTMQYIEQVKADKELQERYDALEEQARQAGIQFIIDLVLTLLSFVPFGGVAAGAARAARAMVPIFKAARATRGIARGLEKALDGAMDAKNIQSVDDLLSPVALEGRGRIGKALSKVEESALDCAESDYLGLALDFLDLGQTVLSTPFARRNDDNSTVIDSELSPPFDPPLSLPRLNETSHVNHLDRRATKGTLTADQKEICVFDPGFKAEALKLPNNGYMQFCHENSATYPFEWIDESDPNNLVVKTVEYSKCRPKPSPTSYTTVAADYKLGSAKRKQDGLPPDPAKCECDHVFEAEEVVLGLNKVKLTDSQIYDICSDSNYKNFYDNLVKEVNSKTNMRGLMKLPNIIKSPFISPDRLQKPKSLTKWKNIAKDTTTLRYKEVEIMTKYMGNAESTRESVAKALDTKIQSQTFSTSKATAVWKKLDLGTRTVQLDGSKTATMGALEEANYQNKLGYLEKLKLANLKPYTPAKRPLSAVATDGDRVTRSGAVYGSCPPAKKAKTSVN